MITCVFHYRDRNPQLNSLPKSADALWRDPFQSILLATQIHVNKVESSVLPLSVWSVGTGLFDHRYTYHIPSPAIHYL